MMLNELLAETCAPDRAPETLSAASVSVYIYRNTAFGEKNATIWSETVSQRYTFQGRESGVAGAPMYFRNRSYNIGLGRFGSRDPMLDAGSQHNLYSAMGGNPVGRTDPMGLWPLWGENGHPNITGKVVDQIDFGVNTDLLKSYVRSRVIKGDVSVDLRTISGGNILWIIPSPFFFLEHGQFQHYNASSAEEVNTARAQYRDFIRTETDSYEQALGTADSYARDARTRLKAVSNCDEALIRLGHACHARQDFFSHAIRPCQSSDGTKIDDRWKVWTSDTIKTQNTPDSDPDVQPSTYPGEHPSTAEPWGAKADAGQMSKSEMEKRLEAARRDTTDYLAPNLARWLRTCGPAYTKEDVRPKQGAQ
jgi:RHS repeat-associated protein